MHLIKSCLMLVLLAGCGPQIVTSVVNERPVTTRLEAQEIILRGAGDLNRVADLYKRGGTKPVEIIATYANGHEKDARYIAQKAQTKLKALGVDNSTITTIPAAQNRVIALVTGLSAGAHPSCGDMPGGETGSSVAAYDYEAYRLGCKIDDALGRQVARTQDLEGRVPGSGYDDATDGQRAGAVVGVYREGKGNPPLEGLSASDTVQREQ